MNIDEIDKLTEDLRKKPLQVSWAALSELSELTRTILIEHYNEKIQYNWSFIFYCFGGQDWRNSDEYGENFTNIINTINLKISSPDDDIYVDSSIIVEALRGLSHIVNTSEEDNFDETWNRINNLIISSYEEEINN